MPALFKAHIIGSLFEEEISGEGWNPTSKRENGQLTTYLSLALDRLTVKLWQPSISEKQKIIFSSTVSVSWISGVKQDKKCIHSKLMGLEEGAQKGLNKYCIPGNFRKRLIFVLFVTS